MCVHLNCIVSFNPGLVLNRPQTLEMVNNIGAKERGTRRGNINGLGSYARAARVAVYDLGLSRTQFNMLAGGFADTLGDNAMVIPFNFEGMPSHVDDERDRLSTQAWKVSHQWASCVARIHNGLLTNMTYIEYL